MALMTMSRMYRCRPSELMGVPDPYTAYCLDEAVAYLMSRVDAGEELVFKREYSSFSDIYKQYE